MVKSVEIRLTSAPFAYNSHHEKAESVLSRSLTFHVPPLVSSVWEK